MVAVRSAALTPVVMPSRVSIAMVKAVPRRLPLFATIGGDAIRCSGSSVMQRQAMTEPARIRVAIIGTVMRSAAIDEVGLVLAVSVVEQDRGTAAACGVWRPPAILNRGGTGRVLAETLDRVEALLAG